MSLEQLRADLAQISESIPKIDANITNFTASRDAWERDKSNCSGTKSKKAECVSFREAKVQKYNALINSQNTLRAQRINQIADIRSEINTANTVSVNLSQQGQTRKSVQVVAEADAKVVAEKGAIEVEGVKTKVAQQGSQGKIILILFAVVAIAVALVVYRKFIKKKA